MLFRSWPFLGFCAAAACATVDSAEPTNELPYLCNDLVIIGRVTALGEEGVPDSGLGPAWQSRWQLQVRIKQIIRGSERRRVVPASGISHARIREDVDLLAVLSPTDGGIYVLKTAALWDARSRPKLVEPCS